MAGVHDGKAKFDKTLEAKKSKRPRSAKARLSTKRTTSEINATSVSRIPAFVAFAEHGRQARYGVSGAQPASWRADIRNRRNRRRARPDSEPIRSRRDREPPGGHSTSLMADGDRLARLRRAGVEAGRMVVDGEREKESPSKSVTAKAGPARREPPARPARGRPDRRSPGGAMADREEAAIRLRSWQAGECSEQGKRAISARPPPSVQRVQRGRPPTAAQPEAESAAPPQRGEHKRRGPPKQNGVRYGAGSAAPCQARRPAGRGGKEQSEAACRCRRRAMTVAATDGPATAEWRSLRLTGRAEGLACRVAVRVFEDKHAA